MSFLHMRRPLTRAGLAVVAVLGSTVAGVGLVGVAPASALTTDLSAVVINEVESNGDTTHGDWIELYNTGSEAVDLSDGILSDADDSHAFPLSGTLAVGGYLAFEVDSGPDGFGLGAPESARLFQGDDPVTGDLIDQYDWALHASTTYGRNPNGTGSFATTSAGTFGAANTFPSGGFGNIAGVVINEVESNADTTHGDWIELYNNTGAGIDISGALLSDSDPGHVFTVPASTTIAAHGYAAFTVDAAFGLGAADSAKLFAPGDATLSTVVDSYSWTSHAVNTYGRNPDGTGSFAPTLAGTFAAANDFGSGTVPNISAVKINEVESAGDTTHGDWVELYNTGASVDISGAIISDNDNSHFFRVPAGTTLAAGGYASFRVDDPALGAAQFGLGDADAARLFAADATNLATATVVDSHTWITNAATTYGRNPNGTGGFSATNAPTFAAANDFSSTMTPDITWVVLNEVESSGGTPGDWIELYNTSGSSINVGGTILSDSDNSHAFTIPSGTTIAAGGYYVVEPDVTGGFGLGADDAVRFYRSGATVGTSIPLDHFEWTTHATTTYGRTAGGRGPWAVTSSPTKGF